MHSAEVAAIGLGVLYACAGWNKLFHPIRRMQMRGTMFRVLPVAPNFFYWFVSLSELTFGLVVLFPWEPSQKIAAAALLVISITAWVLSGRKMMQELWGPMGKVDYLACVLFSPEPLLAILALAVIV